MKNEVTKISHKIKTETRPDDDNPSRDALGQTRDQRQRPGQQPHFDRNCADWEPDGYLFRIAKVLQTPREWRRVASSAGTTKAPMSATARNES